MGIGRREFIKAFGASLAALATAPADAASLVDDFYLNRKLGMGFRKPKGWIFTDVQEMGIVKQGMLLAVDDEIVAGEILAAMDLPFVSVRRPVKTADSFTPGAQFYLVDNSPLLEDLFELGDELERLLDEFDGKDESSEELPQTIQKLRDDAEACDEFLKSFEILSPPQQIQLSACDAAEYTASYLFEHRELAHPLQVRSRTIYVQHRMASYLIRLVDRPHGSLDDEFDFDPFVEGIRLV